MKNNTIKKGTEIDISIDSLAYGGNGISKYNGIVVFTKNVIPGQIVKAKIIKNKKTYLEAIPLEIIKESKYKIEEKCSHFNDCGGCKIQDLEYSQQTKQKFNQTKEALEHIGKIKISSINQIIKSPKIFEYRNKMEFSFSNNRWLISSEKNDTNEKSKEFALGLHPPKRFDKIVDIDYCHIQTKLANEILVEIKKESLSLNLEPYDIINHKGFLRNVIIKHPRFSNQVMVNLVTAYKNHDALLPIVQKVQKISKNIKSIINTINSGKSDSSYGMPKDLLYGENFIVEKLGVYEFEISADSFSLNSIVPSSRT